MSKLEKALICMVEVFEHYAGKDENKSQLSIDELRELFKTELSSPDFKDKIDPENIKEVMGEMDKNHDGDVNFREFSQYMACLAKGYYKNKHGKEKQGREKHGGKK